MYIVLDAFDVLCDQKSFASQQSPATRLIDFNDICSGHNWKNSQTWVGWWKHPQVLRKLCKAFSNLEDND